MPPSELEQRLIDHIAQYGPVTFEAFMDAALYDEHHGYYPSRRNQPGSTPVGTDGDYFTSPSSHPVFGALLALQLDEMWRNLGSPDEFTVVEMGAGDGVLSSDIAEYVQRELPEFSAAISYISTDLVPPSGTDLVRENAAIPVGVTGCVISNELLDAHPVSRFIVQNGQIREIYVDYQNGRFIESVGDVSEPEIAARVEPFLGSLPESYRGEVNLRLGYWSDSVAATLERGYVITIDYGCDRPELYRPARIDGSLRCYYQHTLSQSPLIRIGKQDITAHVDFTAVDHTLMVNGFERIGKSSQQRFLLNLGIDQFISDIRERAALGQLSRCESQEDLAGIGSLIDPEGLGRFRVVVHMKNGEVGVEPTRLLSGILGGEPLTRAHKVPMLNESIADHARLLRASNPFSQSNQASMTEMPNWEQLFSDEP
ncbi:MAG: SAM-dependent methyltransferase [Chloroflexi bacterium]|nr:SAM-dependent methyltransferase [Chloroflexota bacterium]